MIELARSTITRPSLPAAALHCLAEMLVRLPAYRSMSTYESACLSSPKMHVSFLRTQLSNGDDSLTAIYITVRVRDCACACVCVCVCVFVRASAYYLYYMSYILCHSLISRDFIIEKTSCISRQFVELISGI